MMHKREAILLLAHGSPRRLEELSDFLTSVRGGRPMPTPAVEAYADRYRHIGGLSPLSAITTEVRDNLASSLTCPLYVGTRHGVPQIPETVAAMARNGIRHITAICLTPFYSRLSVGAYQTALADSLTKLPTSMTVKFVKSWHREPAYLSGLARTLRQGLDGFSKTSSQHVTVLFSAHSLPATVLEDNDPYPDQLRETVETVTGRVGIPDDQWHLAYQSAPSRARQPWLKPDLRELLRDLAARGQRQILVVPVGFVVDNLETLYDLDIDLKATAESLGVTFQRAPALNASPTLIHALADAIHKARTTP